MVVTLWAEVKGNPSRGDLIYVNDLVDLQCEHSKNPPWFVVLRDSARNAKAVKVACEISPRLQLISTPRLIKANGEL